MATLEADRKEREIALKEEEARKLAEEQKKKADEEASRTAEQERKRKGVASTILTGPEGLEEDAPTMKRILG